jgi:hypothetical protein
MQYNTHMDITNLTFEAVSDLKQYGMQDDGTPFIGEVFCVQATDDKGNRWVHNMRFDGVKPEVDCETGYTAYIDVRPIARFQCKRIINKIKARGYINLANWSAGRPVYGSEAYVAYGQADDVAWERASDPD